MRESVLLDISMPVSTQTAAWPGDVAFSCGWSMTKAGGASVNVGWLKSSPHVGTHVDAPYHYDDAGARVGGLDVEAFVGRALVIDARGHSELGVALFRGLDLRAAPRVLFRTADESDPTRFRSAFPTLTADAVETLAASRVRLVGIDAPSFDDADSTGLPIHHALGRAGITNVENLVLDDVEAGAYELLAAPVRFVDMDAAPLRALLRR